MPGTLMGITNSLPKFRPMSLVTRISPAPPPTPAVEPMNASVSDSARKRRMMAPSSAPSALRIPISRTRSRTLMSRTLNSPIPPTNRVTPAMANITPFQPPRIPSAMARSSSTSAASFSISKSCTPPCRWRTSVAPSRMSPAKSAPGWAVTMMPARRASPRSYRVSQVNGT